MNLVKEFEVDAKNPSLEARQRCQIQFDPEKYLSLLRIFSEEVSKFPDLKLQEETEQIVSFYVDKSKAQEVTKELSQRLEKRGFDVKIIGGPVNTENNAELFSMADVPVFIVGVNQNKKKSSEIPRRLIGFCRRLFGKPAAGCKGVVVPTETIIPIPPYMLDSGDNTEPAPGDMQAQLPSRNLTHQLSLSDGIPSYRSFRSDSNHPNSPSD